MTTAIENLTREGSPFVYIGGCTFRARDNYYKHHSSVKPEDFDERGFWKAGMFEERFISLMNAEPIPKIEIGSFVMGIDRSYERSIYEVLGSSPNGRFVIILWRKLGPATNEDERQATLRISPSEMFSIYTDHVLKPTKVNKLTIPNNWLHEDSWFAEFGNGVVAKHGFSGLI